jgi:GT2 family glycosyltransferase
LLQDDDKFNNLEWISIGLKLFELYGSKLVILGGREALRLLPYDTTTDGKMGKYYVDGDIGGRKNCFKIDFCNTRNNQNEEFKFVQTVNRAPMWINRDLFLNKLFNIDQEYAPCLADDMEICLRAWKQGLKVGWYDARFHVEGLSTGGMRVWNNKLLEYQSATNFKKIYNDYSKYFSEIDLMVVNANKSLSH